MSLADPIADMITRLRNAILARHSEVAMPNSKLKVAICRVLKEEGYILDYATEPDSRQGVLRVQLKYQGNRPVIEGLKRVSKPSRRVYVGHDEIPRVMSGLGINILSTPQGVISDRQARRDKVGGEVVCSVW
ncbi:MAG: 30S ribosomal protein S8 [Desulfarculus sp.]|jgi:small subunit ribosomal protein S8|nr:30S ribosomal protein S8 [Desulfarculus sp.]